MSKKHQSMMIKRLGQYGGYLLSGILIAWLINPIAAIAFLDFFLKMTLLISIPVSGAHFFDKFILLVMLIEGGRFNGFFFVIIQINLLSLSFFIANLEIYKCPL